MKPYRGFVSYVRPASDPSPNCQLITRFGDADAAIAALPMLAPRGGGRAPRVADAATIEREMAAPGKRTSASALSRHHPEPTAG